MNLNSQDWAHAHRLIPWVTFTPADITTDSGSITYHNSYFAYRKLGQLVQFQFAFQLTAGGTGSVRVGAPPIPNAEPVGYTGVEWAVTGQAISGQMLPDGRWIIRGYNNASLAAINSGFFAQGIYRTTEL